MTRIPSQRPASIRALWTPEMRLSGIGALAIAATACVASRAAPAAAQSSQNNQTTAPGTQASAQEPSTDTGPIFKFRTALKTTALASRAPDDPILFPVRDTATAFWRVRLEPEFRLGSRFTAAMAYEHRLRLSSATSGLAADAILPAATPGSFRVRQLDSALATTSRSSWRHELDRGWIGMRLDRAELTIGRQAIGWGRGVLFGAVDMFGPFSPVEVDREWRRGVDAVRADVELADRVSLDLISAFGSTMDTSAFAARLRGYAGQVDLEIVGGSRARDPFVGATTSAAVANAEVHGEVAVFRAPEGSLVPTSDGNGNQRLVVKAVAGGSYQLRLGNGLLVSAEYHYSGFGATTPGDILRYLQDPRFRERYQRGDTQILLRHAIAAIGSYEFSPVWRVTSQWLHSPVDGSGLWSPSATVTLGDRWSVFGSMYLPYGRAPTGVVLRSEYGTLSRSLLIQLRIYS